MAALSLFSFHTPAVWGNDTDSRLSAVVWDAEVTLSTFALSLLYRPPVENTKSTKLIYPPISMNNLMLHRHA